MTRDPTRTRLHEHPVPLIVVGVVVLALAVAGPLIQQARRARAAQDNEFVHHMTPNIPIPEGPNVALWCTCLKDYAALAEMYGRPQ